MLHNIQKIRPLLIVHFLFNHPEGVTLNKLFFFLTTRNLAIKRECLYKDIQLMRTLGFHIKFLGNKIFLTNKELPNF